MINVALVSVDWMNRPQGWADYDGFPASHGGFVGVSCEHPWFQKDFDDPVFAQIRLCFSAARNPCTGEVDGLWWLGFTSQNDDGVKVGLNSLYQIALNAMTASGDKQPSSNAQLSPNTPDKAA